MDDEEIVVRPACSIGEVEVFQPYDGVGVSRVLDNIRQRMEARQEWCLLDPFCERLQSVGVWDRAVSSFPNPRMLAMVVQVAVTVV